MPHTFTPSDPRRSATNAPHVVITQTRAWLTTAYETADAGTPPEIDAAKELQALVIELSQPAGMATLVRSVVSGELTGKAAASQARTALARAAAGVGRADPTDLQSDTALRALADAVTRARAEQASDYVAAAVAPKGALRGAIDATVSDLTKHAKALPDGMPLSAARASSDRIEVMTALDLLEGLHRLAKLLPVSPARSADFPGYTRPGGLIGLALTAWKPGDEPAKYQPLAGIETPGDAVVALLAGRIADVDLRLPA